jgi:hypothetical protein
VVVSEGEGLEQVNNESASYRIIQVCGPKMSKNRTVLRHQRNPTYLERQQKRLRRQQQDREKTMENWARIFKGEAANASLRKQKIERREKKLKMERGNRSWGRGIIFTMRSIDRILVRKKDQCPRLQLQT